jgi:hypothetical protein
MDHEAELVDQVEPNEEPNELRAPLDLDIPMLDGLQRPNSLEIGMRLAADSVASIVIIRPLRFARSAPAQPQPWE